MDVTELRIGNIISDIQSNPTKVTGINDKVVNTEWGGIFVENLKGVPLTEEWLTKFGFHSDQGDELGVYRRQVGNNLDFMVNLITHEAGFSMGWRNDFCSVWKEVKYAHEVQNIIYFISKEELEVK